MYSRGTDGIERMHMCVGVLAIRLYSQPGGTHLMSRSINLDGITSPGFTLLGNQRPAAYENVLSWYMVTAKARIRLRVRSLIWAFAVSLQ